MQILGNEPGMSFYVVGSGDDDTLVVTPAVRGGGTVVLRLPVQGLPWRDMRLLERYGRRERYGCGDRDDPLVRVKATLTKPEEIADRTGIQGATAVHLENGLATVEIAPRETLLVPCLRVAEGVRMPTAVQVTGRTARRARGAIRVAQLAGGRRVGGVTLRLRDWTPNEQRGAPDGT